MIDRQKQLSIKTADLSRQIAHRQEDWRLVAILRVAETGALLPAGECVFTAKESGPSLQNCF
jgi:hypothetical protein